MKGFSGIYYLFFVLLIMGGFSAMAQNRYGLYILGAVGVLFGIIFLYQCYLLLTHKDKSKRFWSLEPASLAVLSFLITLRVFYIHFPFIEGLLGIAVFLLILVYATKMLSQYRHYQTKNRFLAILIPAFYFTIVLYLVSMVSIAFLPTVSEFAGITAFGLLIIILVAGLIKGGMLLDGENQSFFKVAWRLKDNSVLIASLFCLFSVYAGLTRTGILPRIYSDEYPQAYFEMVDKAESGKAKDDEKSSYQLYKQRYEEFLKRNIKKAH